MSAVAALAVSNHATASLSGSLPIDQQGSVITCHCRLLTHAVSAFSRLRGHRGRVRNSCAQFSAHGARIAASDPDARLATWRVWPLLLAYLVVRVAVYKTVAITMLILMFPGSFELLQDGVHWVLEGHTPHDPSTEHHDEGPTQEHSCSGPYHVCICHSSGLFVTQSTVQTPAQPSPRSCEIVARVAQPCPSSHLDRLFRPPMA